MNISSFVGLIPLEPPVNVTESEFVAPNGTSPVVASSKSVTASNTLLRAFAAIAFLNAPNVG
jgi:hypothetical protein